MHENLHSQAESANECRREESAQRIIVTYKLLYETFSKKGTIDFKSFF